MAAIPWTAADAETPAADTAWLWLAMDGPE